MEAKELTGEHVGRTLRWTVETALPPKPHFGLRAATEVETVDRELVVGSLVDHGGQIQVTAPDGEVDFLPADWAVEVV